MRPLDWVVLVALSGLRRRLRPVARPRQQHYADSYLLAGKTMPWYAMALSIMATQASAITFISTTGQSYVDGMRFVQFYFGLPIAMVMICGDRRADLPSRQCLYGVRISGAALRCEDARAGQHHLPDPARALGGADASMRRRSCSTRHPRLARPATTTSAWASLVRDLHGHAAASRRSPGPTSSRCASSSSGW